MYYLNTHLHTLTHIMEDLFSQKGVLLEPGKVDETQAIIGVNSTYYLISHLHTREYLLRQKSCLLEPG